MADASTTGKITIDPSVLETIARLTTLAVPGVVRLTAPEGLQRILGVENGVRIVVQEGRVTVDLYITVEPRINLLNLGHQIQIEVTRAICDIVGMAVESVNVHVEDIYFSRSDT